MDLDEGIPILEEQNGEISNPFINKQTVIDFKYTRILILSSEEDININDFTSFTKEDYIEFCKKLYILKGHTFMTNNIHNKYNMIVVDYDNLKYISSDIELEEKEVVITLWGLKKDVVKLYVEQYVPDTTFDKYLQLIKLNSYLNDDNGLITFNRCKYLINLDCSNFWAIYNNCKKTITIQFMNRNFRSQINNIKDTTLKNTLLKIEELDDDYLLFMRRDQLYIDISNSVNNNGYNKYYISDTSEYSNNEITTLINNITNERGLYLLVSNLMISKNLCHLIINNKEVLEILNSHEYYIRKFNKNTTFIKKYILMIKYCLGYTWITFYLEESIKKTFIKDTDRFVFDIHTANLLPYFPFISTQPKSSPYFSFLVSDAIANIENNNLTFGCVTKNNSIFEHGVTDLITFENRLEVFCNIKYDTFKIFDNINWSNIAVSGSVIAACLPRNNPLMMKYNNINKSANNIFEDYIDEYYNTSDLDIMCNNDNIIDYIRTVYEIYETIKTNINKINIKTITNIIQLKSVVVYVSDNYINNKLISESKSYDYIINNLNIDNDIKVKIFNEYLSYHYNEMATHVNNKIFKEDLFNNYFEPCLIENIKIYKSNTEYENNVNELYFYKNIKYKILKNEVLRRDLEIFKIKYKDYFSSVSKFHLPCVRAYYNGSNVYMLPSCITAMMTFINIDYKYFAGTNNPYDIINKYSRRGFATLLNDTEKINNIQYIINFTPNNDNINIRNINSVNKVYGLKKLIFYDCYQIINKNQLLIEYNKITSIKPDLFDIVYTHINKYGYINPLKKYILEMIFDIS